ncbi:hypothetical protein KEM54_001517, partial [Ascosphaera aggregata]
MNPGVGSEVIAAATPASLTGNNGTAMSKGFKKVGSADSVQYSPLGDGSDNDDEGISAAGPLINGHDQTRRKNDIVDSGVVVDSLSTELAASGSQARDQKQNQRQQGKESRKTSADSQNLDQDNRDMIKGYSWATPYDFQTPPKPSLLQYIKWIT